MAIKKTTQGTVRFTLRTDKTNKDGNAPVELTYSLHGQRKRVNTKLHSLPEAWDPENQKAFYTNKKDAKKNFPEIDYIKFPMASDVESFNAALSNWKEKVRKAENNLKDAGLIYSASDVSELIKKQVNKNKSTKKEEPKNYLTDFITFHLENTKATSNPGTQKIYKTLVKTIEDYEKKKRTRITLTNADYSFMQNFYSFCVETKKYVNPTSQKKISSIKNMLKVANVKYGYKTNDSYKNFTTKKDELEVIALTPEEYESLIKLDLADNPRLDKTRDVFIFSCTTGLRYSDLENLKRENIKDDFLRIAVKKTRTLLEIPLSGIAYDILAKYEGNLKPLPVISNQKMNKNLKDLCKAAEIDESVEIVRYKGKTPIVKVFNKWELITVHTGRKSFVTLSLAGGMPAELVMEISGHKSYEAFKRYINISQEQKRKAMLNVWGDVQLKVSGGIE